MTERQSHFQRRTQRSQRQREGFGNCFTNLFSLSFPPCSLCALWCGFREFSQAAQICSYSSTKVTESFIGKNASGSLVAFVCFFENRWLALIAKLETCIRHTRESGYLGVEVAECKTWIPCFRRNDELGRLAANWKISSSVSERKPMNHFVVRHNFREHGNLYAR